MPNSKCTGVQLALLLIVSTLAAPGVLAQENNPTGIGVAIGIGASNFEDEDAPGDTFEGRDFGWNLDVEWRFIKHLAIGANFTFLGEDTDDFNGARTTIGVNGFGLYLRGYWPVTPSVTLHARYGDTGYNVDIEPGADSFFLDSARDYGVGGDFFLNDNIALRFETRWLDGPRQEAGGLTTIGLRWQF